MKLLAIDPGGEHVGLAEFSRAPGTGEWRCNRAWELTPSACIAFLEHNMGRLDYLIYEGFRLYPWLADTQKWSSFPTVELIGVIKYLWAKHAKKSCRIQEQLADKKKPTLKIMRARKQVSEAKRTKAGGHAFDAELHGAYFIEKTLGGKLGEPE